MSRYFFLIIATVYVLTGACAGRKSKAAHKDTIPEKDLISILTDIHIADGLLTVPEINYKFSNRDTISSYIEIIEGYGYSKAEMDRTMRYYFIRKPRKLIKVYDKVLGKLSEMESRLDKELPVSKAEGINFWQGKSSYYFPDQTGEDTTWFDFQLAYAGLYNLKFTMTLYPDDQSFNPRPGVYYYYPDSTENRKRNYISDFPFIKDGLPHTYSFVIPLRKSSPVRLMGWFIDLENQAPFRENHFRIDNITLTRSPI